MRQPTVQPAPAAVRPRMFVAAPTSRGAGDAAFETWEIRVTLLLNHTLSINISTRNLPERRNGLFRQQVWTKTARSAPELVGTVKAVAKRMMAFTVLRLPWEAREAIPEAPDASDMRRADPGWFANRNTEIYSEKINQGL